MSEAAVKLDDKPLMERIVSLCKRRGFIYQASEIYGGLNGVYDYGPLGSQFKRNLADRWWKDMVECPPDGPDGKALNIVGVDSAILQLRQVWDAVGHTKNFNDMMVDCRESKLRYRADHIVTVPMLVERQGQAILVGLVSAMDGEEARDVIAKKAKKLLGKTGGGKLLDFDFSQMKNYLELDSAARTTVIGPDVDAPGTLTEPRAFNLMFDTYIGVFRDEDTRTFLRPETCQGIFTNFKNVLDTSRVKVPFGIAQIGKAFRNEVTPRNYIFRTREFEQMELEFFVHPDEARMWFEYWVDARVKWWEGLGLTSSKLYKHEIPASERAFYSQGTFDIEYQFPFSGEGFGELEGVAHRADYDLLKHQEAARVKMDYFEPENNLRFVPHVIEPAAGLTRGVLALLCEGYRVDESRASPEWLQLDARLAPVKAGIFPLVNKDGMPEMAEKIYADLRRKFVCQFDAKQSIGKRYARMDECGTPFCITVDGDSAANNDVTVRNRDTATQERVNVDRLTGYLAEKLA